MGIVRDGIVRDTGEWALETDVVVVGAGGCGLTAAIAAARSGAQVLALEKAKKPLSNTARSGGMVPAAGTRFQRAAGVNETPGDFAADIRRKNHGEADEARVLHLARTATTLVEWLVDEVGVALTFVGDFRYPGHTQCRMHAPPNRTGAALVEDLRRALQALPTASLVTGSPAIALVADGDGAVLGVVAKQGAERVRVKARKVILACSGYAGSAALLSKHCPEIAPALYFGGEGSTGEGIVWGEALGGRVAFMDAYQGHASVAHPHGILITYAAVTEGGVQVDANGERFVDETRGYSENALVVLGRPGGFAYDVYDERIHALAMGFDDYREALGAGAIKHGATLAELAGAIGVPADAFERTMAAYQRAARGEARDPFGRADCRVLTGPFHAVRVTGALFHTQGGLEVDPSGRVLRASGGVVPNLYAGGGVAAGVSGHGPGGYLSGNGLLTALGYGMLAGRHAASAIAAETAR